MRSVDANVLRYAVNEAMPPEDAMAQVHDWIEAPSAHILRPDELLIGEKGDG